MSPMIIIDFPTDTRLLHALEPSLWTGMSFGLRIQSLKFSTLSPHIVNILTRQPAGSMQLRRHRATARRCGRTSLLHSPNVAVE